MNATVIMWILIIIVLFICYLIFDFATSNLNQFLDKWARKTLWIWLPFYGLQRLIREVFFRKK
jgi:hypothetical protein